MYRRVTPTPAPDPALLRQAAECEAFLAEPHEYLGAVWAANA